MSTYSNQTEKDQQQSLSSTHTQEVDGSEHTQKLTDNRPEAIAQQKLQTMANQSPHVTKNTQLQAAINTHTTQNQLRNKVNNTGLPNQLKSGIENLSGYSMDDVKVHYNSDKPAQLQAHAFAQGTDIHIAPGQEKHLSHEAWHVVQQKQGRVNPTQQMKGVNVNSDSSLEHEADTMGDIASRQTTITDQSKSVTQSVAKGNQITQRVSINLQPADPVIKKLLKYTKEKLGVNDQVLESVEAAEDYTLGKTEDIYLFGHGGYSGVEVEEHDLFAGMNMTGLATGLNDNITFPEDYTGTIYLIGCKTDTLLSSFKTQLDQLTGKSLNVKGTTETLQTGEDDDISLRDQPGSESEVKRREIADIQRYFYQRLIDLRNLRGTALKGIKEADDFEKKKTAIMAAYMQKNSVDAKLKATRDALEKLKNVTSIKLLGKKSGIKSMEEIFAQSKLAQDQIQGHLLEFLDLYEKKPRPVNISDLEGIIIQKLTDTLKKDHSSLSEQVSITALMVQINDEPDLLGTTAFNLDQMVDVTGAKKVKNLKDSKIQFNSVTTQIQGWTQTALKRTLLWSEISAELTNPQQDWSKDETAATMNLKIKKLGTYLSVLHRLQVSQTSPDLIYDSANEATRRKLNIDHDFSVKKSTFIRLLEREKPENFIGSALELCNQMNDIYKRLTVEAATETSSTLGHSDWPFGF